MPPPYYYRRRRRRRWRRVLGHCRVCGKPLRNPRSARLGIGPECMGRGGRRRRSYYSRPRVRFASRPAYRPQPPSKPPSPARPTALGALRGTVLAASCAVAPYACATFMAVSTAYDAISLARKVLDKLNPTPKLRWWQWSKPAVVIARNLVATAVDNIAAGMASPTIESIGYLVASSLQRSGVTAGDQARVVTQKTIVGALEGGRDGLVSWGIEEDMH